MEREILAYCRGCGAKFMAILPREGYCPTCLDEGIGQAPKHPLYYIERKKKRSEGIKSMTI